jgi:hypothetical protein
MPIVCGALVGHLSVTQEKLGTVYPPTAGVVPSFGKYLSSAK